MSLEGPKVDFSRMYEPKDIIELIADNVRKTRNPLGLSNSAINTWWKDLGIKREGTTMLFTGLMYQLIPYIENMTKRLESYETSWLKDKVGMAKMLPKFLLRLLFGKPISKEVKERFDNIVKNIARLLMKASVDFCYKPEVDNYSGILLYDLGDIDGFKEHARYVVSSLKEAGVKEVITVDPHTTYAFRVLYPKLIGEEIKAYTYFETLSQHSIEGKSDLKITIHDPCFYGRYLKVSDVPRVILSNLGVEVRETENHGKLTICCGGPLESLYPSYAKELGKRRVEELKKTGCPIIGMCPICLANLGRAGIEIKDLSELLSEIILK